MSEEVQGGATKKFLYVNRRPPYGTIYAHESLEVVLIGAAFEQDVSLAFLGDGVYRVTYDLDRRRVAITNPDVQNVWAWYRAERPRDPDRVADWVLARPRPAEREALDAATDRVIEAIERAAVDGVELAMTRLPPPGKGPQAS